VGGRAYEETGRLNLNYYYAQTGGGWDSASPALYEMFNGDDAVFNRRARLNTRVPTVSLRMPVYGTANWTIEIIASFAGFNNCTLFEWVSSYDPQDFSGTWIRVDWASGAHRIDITLRDEEQANSDYVSYSMCYVPRDGEWHHIAIAKEAGTLRGYVDYQNANVYGSISTAVNGSYTFDAASAVHIGQRYDQSNTAQNGIRFDEIRFSSGVPFLENFLRIDHPYFSAAPEENGSSCDLTFVGDPWTVNTIYRRSSLISGSWIDSGSHWAPTNYIGEEKIVTVTKPSSVKGFYKIQ